MTAIVPLFAGVILFNVLAQLLFKAGSGKGGLSDVFPLSLVNVQVIMGIGCLAVALVGYLMILQRLPLILAQSLLSLQFAATVIGAAAVLGERVSMVQWSGIALIGVGLLLLSR